MSGDLFGDFILWGLAFIFSTTVHEASHAFVAKLGGDLTAYSVGQASLNPMPHIKREPVGMILFPVITFFLNAGQFMIGWASAPYDPHWAARYPKRSALMALAGPLSNTVIFLIAFVILKFGFGGFHATLDPESVLSVVHLFFKILLQLNLILLIFNLLPLPPLDGSEAILLFFPESAAEEVRSKIRSLGLFGLLIALLVFNVIYGPIIRFVISLT